MISLRIILQGDGCFSDLKDKDPERIIHVIEGISVALLEHGMKSGKPAVAIRIDLPDDRTVIGETSLALFLSAADAFKARTGDPRKC